LLHVATFSLMELLRNCAPNIGPRTMTAIVQVESGGNPLAIHDNTINRSLAPGDRRTATAWATQLIGMHHNVDLGLAQINSMNFASLGMSIGEAFDPCINVHAGSIILATDYRAAVEQFGAGQYALRRAIGAYNSGSLFAGFDYIDRVLRAAGIAAEADFIVPDLRATPLMPVPRNVANVKPRVRPPPGPPPMSPYASPILVVVPSRGFASNARPAQAILPSAAAAPAPPTTTAQGSSILPADAQRSAAVLPTPGPVNPPVELHPI